ncbi:MAG: DUF6688 family protein [Ferruginibacter sp.]
MIAILIFISFPAIFSFINFIGFVTRGKPIVNIFILRIMEPGAFIFLPWLYISMATENDCCGDSAAFSPQHLPTILTIIILCVAAYFYSSYRKKISSPVVEIIVNSLLLMCIGLNIIIAIHTNDLFLATLGNMPIILFTILVLVKNHKLFMEFSNHSGFKPNKMVEKLCWRILTSKPIIKFPVILVICLPILFILSALLLLIGQKPDSLVRAFTDTYKHGFSQWDHKCDNVQCGGHYLCSVAANGHKKIVRPKRLGIRKGNYIICNRQLLISNAFEELLQENLPQLHKSIRKQYNKVGNFVHRYYSVFNIKIISDLIYLLMKPLEWIFLITLYTFSRKPENRIAKQYLSFSDRQKIENS